MFDAWKMVDPKWRQVTRRGWLTAAVAAGWGLSARGDEPGKTSPVPPLRDDEPALRSIAARAAKVGLGPLAQSRSANYLAAGDAPEVFRRNVLQACEAVALDFLEYYGALGFAVKRPDRRLVIVALADRRSFIKYFGADLGPNIGGLYSRRANALIVYDHRVAIDNSPRGRARFANQVSQAHEATHQLCYNTGLLNRAGDVPGCISEGIAQYGEIRRTTGRTPPGMLNQDRLRDLAHGQRQGNPWIPVARLLVEDDQLQSDASAGPRSVAYAESWLLVHMLLKETPRLPAFRSYLRGIYDRHDGTRRLADAEQHLGNLDQLDADLRRYAIRLMKQG